MMHGPLVLLSLSRASGEDRLFGLTSEAHTCRGERGKEYVLDKCRVDPDRLIMDSFHTQILARLVPQ